MPTLPLRAAAYTRTGILKRFLDHVSDALPARVDSAYAESRLGLKGGDVRAFLQSLRVLGLVDPYGQVTDRARRTRGMTQRGAAMREALRDAYPELVERWDRRGGMPREEVEDFFKVEYGLSTSSTGPAAKLFTDLMQEYGRPEPPRYAEPLPFPPPALERSPLLGGLAEERDPTWSPPATAVPVTPSLPAPDPPAASDVRLAALDAIKSAVRIDINSEWDEKRIELVFDRMERLVARILAAGGSS